MRLQGLGICLVTAVAVASCGSNEQTKPKDPSATASTGCRIKVPESQDKPFLVEWDAQKRQAFEQRLRTGVVVVHYEDCNLEVLEKCASPAKYRWAPSPPKQDKLSISNIEQLWANVPIGASNLESVIGGGELSIEATRVGLWHTTERIEAGSLQGPDCARATHVITAIAAGAFQMYANRGAHSRSGVSAGDDKDITRTSLAHAGRFEACDASNEGGPPRDCATPIRIEVAKILATAHVCKPGDRRDCAEQCKNDNDISCQRLAALVTSDDDIERTNLFKRGCDRDDMRACNNYSVMLVRGVAVAHDLPRARTLLVRACDNGINEACANAGLVLGRDEYSNQLKDPTADTKLRQACSQRVASGCFEAGSRLGDDGRTPPDAVALLTKACDMDHGRACAKLATLHRTTDKGLASKLSAKACSLGARSACPSGDSSADDRPWSSELIVLPPP